MQTKTAKFPLSRLTALRAALISGVLGVVLVPGWAVPQQPNPPRNLPEFINRLPDENDQARMRQAKQAQQKNYEAANAYLQKKVSDDSAKLLKMASDLKTEVDKSGKDTLSLNVLRKAGEIEKLAKTIRSEVAQESRSN